MYRVPPDRAWWRAVGAPLERGVTRNGGNGHIFHFHDSGRIEEKTKPNSQGPRSCATRTTSAPKPTRVNLASPENLVRAPRGAPLTNTPWPTSQIRLDGQLT
jgi:hypothetical protein